MRGTGMTACLLAIQLLAMPAAMAGEMYQWTDANGKRHFTDKPPPPGVQAERSTLRDLPAKGPRQDAEANAGGEDPAAAFQREQAADLAERRRERQEAKQKREDAEKRWAAEQEDREWEHAKRQREQKETKCRNLKDAADRASGLKARWEKECG